MQIFDGARTWFGNGFATTVFLPISERTMALRVTSSAEVQAERRTPEPSGRESHARLPHRGPKGLAMIIDKVRQRLGQPMALSGATRIPASGHASPDPGCPDAFDPRRARPRRHQVFIMHAHGEDPRLAQMLARELERFRPVSRGAQIYLDPNVAGAVETPWESIVYPLAASAHLVFLASPGAAQSTRCQQAVKYWLARHPLDTVTLVLASGTIRWDGKSEEFDKKVTNALPPGLLT